MAGQKGPTGARTPRSSNRPGSISSPERAGDPRPPLRPLPPQPGQGTPSLLERTASSAVPIPRHSVVFYDPEHRPLAWTRQGFAPARHPTRFHGTLPADLHVGHALSAGGPGHPAWVVVSVMHQPALSRSGLATLHVAVRPA